MNLIMMAEAFAHGAHNAIGQKRKYTGEPYTVHLDDVCRRVLSVGGTPEMAAAALLHDVLEDTQVVEADLRRFFPEEVIEWVVALTDTPKTNGMNRAMRKEMDRARLAAAPAEVQTIKVADLISNSHSIIQNDIHFSVVYMSEKTKLMNVLKKADPRLVAQAEKIITNYYHGAKNGQ